MEVTTKTGLKELICSDKNRSGFYSKESAWKKKFPMLYKELNSWNFPEDFSFKQKIYHYLNNDLELKLGICQECGKRCRFINSVIGYHQFCSIKCSANSKETRGHYQQTCLEKYGCENPAQSEEVQEKMKQTCLERYNCENPMQCEEVKEKSRQTCLERYDCEYSAQSIKAQLKLKQTCLEKYGKEHYAQTDDYKEKFKNKDYVKIINEKIYQTKKKNNSFNTSKIEEQLKQYFIDNNINFISQYKSDLYPFACDFYFPDTDLYVEIQGSWTHGYRPFTGSDEDLEQLEKWKSKNSKYYNKAIGVWSVSDVKKRETAKQNNLNWIEIFSCDFNKCISEILKLIN